MTDELDLNELAKLAEGLQFIEGRYSGYEFYYFDGLNPARELTLEEVTLIKNTLPRLIELARIGQQADTHENQIRRMNGE